MLLLRRVLLISAGLLATFRGMAAAGVYTVTNTDDSGPGSLRQAILDADAHQPSDVAFAIGTGHQKIRPLTPLPTMIGGNIAGGTQPGFSSIPLIEIDGSLMAAGSTCMTIKVGWIESLVVNRCPYAGVSLDLFGGVRRSYIGTDVTGTTALPNQIGVTVFSLSTTVGGAQPGDGNVISGNVTGVSISGSSVFVMGNRIGTDASGMSSVPNQDGVDVRSAAQIGGPTPWHGNLISGNSQFGITITVADATGTVIQNNVIGPDAAGGLSLPSQRAGVMISGTTGLELRDNVIADNWEVGIGVQYVSVRDRLARNLFFGNAFDVDLAYDSSALDRRTPNDDDDADTGTNLLQNFPLLEPATVSGGLVAVRGTLNSEPSSTFTIELFATQAGGGQVLVGTVPAETDAAGDASFSATLPAEAAAGDSLVATATDAFGDTSEVSDPAAIADSAVQVAALVPDSGPSAGGTAVTLTGAGFQAGAAVLFGFVPAGSVDVVGPAEIQATAPAHEPGTVSPVVVENGDLSTGGVANGWFADFLDVAEGDMFHDQIETIVRAGITAGCSGGNYCPLASVTRAQMAVFLLRAKLGAAYLPPPATFTRFADVIWNTFAADWIEDLAGRGITGGCGNGNYCPDSPVTRAQMSAFLLKTEHGAGYVPPACAPTFDDVPCPSTFADWIQQLAVENITGGCGGNNFCPDASNTRGQMAVFLTKTFLTALAP